MILLANHLAFFGTKNAIQLAMVSLHSQTAESIFIALSIWLFS
jgi:hypothetical protein